MTRLSAFLIAAVGLLPVIAAAQSGSANSTQRNSLRARQDMRAIRETKKQVERQDAVQRDTLTVGVAYDRDEEGTHATTTPYQWEHQFGDLNNPWKFRLKGDGYTKSREAGATSVDGFGDVELHLDHGLGLGFSASVNLVLPSKGDVGSRTASQGGTLICERDFGTAWTASASASLDHENGAPAGKSAYAKQLYADLNYKVDADRNVLFSMARTWRAGTPSTTDLGVEYDFPILAKKLSGALSLVRGITSGSRHTAIEFDLSHKF